MSQLIDHNERYNNKLKLTLTLKLLNQIKHYV